MRARRGAASALGFSPKWEALLEDAGLNPGAAQEAPKMPDRALYDSNEEAYWTEMRKQFLIPADEVHPIQIGDIETWMWKTKKIRIRGGGPSKIRLSTPYYLGHKDVDRFLAAFDEYKKGKAAA